MKSCIKLLALLLSSAVYAVLLSSCETTKPEKKHVYDYGDDEEVSNQPWVRPSNTFDGGGGLGNLPQSR